jgi:hypothetical protein
LTAIPRSYINKEHIFQNKWSHAKFHEHQLKSSATESLESVDKQGDNLNQQITSSLKTACD